MAFPVEEAIATIARHWPWFWPLVGGLLGAVFGSFLNCVRWRIPNKVSLRHPPSMCPSCKTRLGVPDLVPILSFLALRGRCRHCGVSIGSSSLWMEIASTLVFTLAIAILQSCLLS